MKVLASPSNVAMATLVGFLFIGHGTDWKMLRGRSTTASLSVIPALPEHSSDAAKSPSQQIGSAARKISPRSEVVDRRGLSHAGTSQRELD